MADVIEKSEEIPKLGSPAADDKVAPERSDTAEPPEALPAADRSLAIDPGAKGADDGIVREVVASGVFHIVVIALLALSLALFRPGGGGLEGEDNPIPIISEIELGKITSHGQDTVAKAGETLTGNPDRVKGPELAAAAPDLTKAAAKRDETPPPPKADIVDESFKRPPEPPSSPPDLTLAPVASSEPTPPAPTATKTDRPDPVPDTPVAKATALPSVASAETDPDAGLSAQGHKERAARKTISIPDAADTYAACRLNLQEALAKTIGQAGTDALVGKDGEYKFRIGKDMKPEEIEIISSFGSSRLDRIAKVAMAQVKFKPAPPCTTDDIYWTIPISFEPQRR